MRKNKGMSAVENELKLAEGVATEIKHTFSTAELRAKIPSLNHNARWKGIYAGIS
jgi:hypothetical protein